jgi:S-adenosylmethionine hydrolase
MAAANRPIVFLTDFGYRNEWVGICHAVMCRTAPDCRVIDLSHGIPPLDVRGAALLLLDSLSFLPDDAVVLAVVDPNVGTDKDLAVETAAGRLLVGPDNGLLAPAWRALGGIRRAVEITSPDIVLEPVAPTFHARDVLSPAAAHLAAGGALDELGGQLEADQLIELQIVEPETDSGRIRCEVLDLNRFGNVQLNVRRTDLETAGLDSAAVLTVEGVARSVRARCVATYADVEPGEYGAIIDPRGWLTLIRGNPENAAEGLGLQSGDPVWVAAAPAG